MFTYNGVRFNELEEVTVKEGPFKGVRGKFIGSKHCPTEQNQLRFIAEVRVDHINTLEVEFSNLQKDGIDYIICLVSEFAGEQVIEKIIHTVTLRNDTELGNYLTELDRGLALKTRIETFTSLKMQINEKLRYFYKAFSAEDMKLEMYIDNIPLRSDVVTYFKSRMM